MYKIALVIFTILKSLNCFAQGDGVLNTYYIPINADKNNSNGHFRRDHLNNYYIMYYDGLVTKITNNKEIPLLQSTKGTVFCLYQTKPNVYFGWGLDHAFTISNNSVNYMYSSIGYNTINLNHYFTDGSYYGSYTINQMQYLFYFKNNKKYLIDSLDGFNKNYFSIPQTYNFTKPDSFTYCKYYTDSFKIVQLYQQKPFAIKTNYTKLISPNANFFYNKPKDIVFSKVIINMGFIYNKKELNNLNISGYEVEDFYNNNIITQVYNYPTESIFNIKYEDKFDRGLFNSNSNSLLLASNNQPKIAFTTLKKYPNLYGINNALSTFAITLDSNNNIWAGSYNKGLSYIDNKGKVHIVNNTSIMSNGALSIGNDVYFIDEGLRKIQKFNTKNKSFTNVQMPNNWTGFYIFKSSKNIIYYGTSSKGLYYTTLSNLQANNGKWQIIPPEKLGDIQNILTINEDKLGRIWFGHSKKNIAILTPSNNNIQLIKVKNKDLDVGMFSSICDSNGTMWIGTGYDGLYAVDANKQIITAADFKKIIHPFFPAKTRINAMAINGNYLIINTFNKTLALDLNQYYNGIINIKYLTERETSYTSFTEQNTMLVAKDSTVWYSTSDNLYQWNFYEWLAIPKEKIKFYPTINYQNKCDTINKSIRLDPFRNSFNIELDYYHPDLLPRYFCFALQYENDSIIYSNPQIGTTLEYKNLAPGKYTLHVQVMELDGTLSQYKYIIDIDKIWYKKPWILGLFALGIMGMGAVLYNSHNRRKRAELLAKNKMLELEQIKTQTEKELSQLKVKSLANQIRPHFLLNTLNTIGAYTVGKPNAEKLISKLGDSINHIFNQSLSENNLHDLFTEWHLCENIVSIYNTIYLPQLQFINNAEDNKSMLNEYFIPFGLLQIPIENALLHGLQNKIALPHILEVNFDAYENGLQITISDNGIGRKKSSTLSNRRSHGTGIKNLEELVNILNKNYNQGIAISYQNQFEDIEDTGTVVTIFIPIDFKQYNQTNTNE
jgi:hypothetical protein